MVARRSPHRLHDGPRNDRSRCPALRSGRLLFTYFEAAGYNTYAIDDPLSLPRTPVRPALVADGTPDPAVPADSARAVSPDGPANAPPPAQAGVQAPGNAGAVVPPPGIAGGAALPPDSANGGIERIVPVPLSPDVAVAVRRPSRTMSFYRSSDGRFRPSAEAPSGDAGPAPVSVVALLDSAALALPDTVDFEYSDYKVRFTADMIGRPSIGTQVGGYYGNGVYGGTFVSLSDMLGNHNILLAGNINGALSDASFFGAYTFLKTRANWSAAAWQVPLYRYMGGGYFNIETAGQQRQIAANVFLRDMVRAAQGGVSYPFSTFRRVEFNVTGVHYKSEVLYRGYDLATYEPVEIDQRYDGFGYFQPEVALVFDNSLMGWTGPIYGRRYRAQLSRTIGDLNFTEALLDFRNYTNWKQRVVLATRLVGLTRLGAEADRFGLYWGGPYYIRGYDYNSFEPLSPECIDSRFYGDEVSISRCPVRDQLVGSSAAFLNTELRFPIITELQIGFLGAFPPVDAVAFFDGGIAWDSRVCRAFDYTRRDNCAAGESENVRVTWDRKPGEDPYLVREPLFSYGLGLRLNVFYTIIRLDYSWPLNRPDRGGVLSFSFGPSF